MLSLLNTKIQMRKSVLVFTVVSLVGIITAAKYPNDLKRCHYGDVECIRDTINLYARTLQKGRRDLGLIPFDPLYVDEVVIEQGNKSPVNVNLKFRNLKGYGIGTANVKSVIGFERDPLKSKFEFNAHIDHISLVGQYKVRGNILLLPIIGNGAVNLTFDNVDANIKFITKVEVRNDKQYLRISELKLSFDTTRLWMNFDNLFNGDRTLSDSMNVFLNENWKEILAELKPVLTKAIGDIYKAIADPIFRKFPYEDLFLRDDEQ